MGSISNSHLKASQVSRFAEPRRTMTGLLMVNFYVQGYTREVLGADRMVLKV